MQLLTEDAILACAHILGIVTVVTTQDLVSIQGRGVLVEADPESRSIKGCPNIGLTIKPCTSTLRVQEGYSDLLRVEGRRICLETVTGLTDGTPPGTVLYEVRDPGQDVVRQT